MNTYMRAGKQMVRTIFRAIEAGGNVVEACGVTVWRNDGTMFTKLEYLGAAAEIRVVATGSASGKPPARRECRG
jgi:hypothetical protein